MSISNGPNLGLMKNANTGESHDAALRALLRGIDGLVMPNAKGYLTNTPPGSPANGDLYIIGAAPTGAWAGQGGKVTRYSVVAAAWEFFTPKNGWTIQSNSARETYRYTGGAWEIYYQEGTWTASLRASSSESYSTTAITAAYVKHGQQIVASFVATLTSTATNGADALYISGGLPFTASSPVGDMVGTCEVVGSTINNGISPLYLSFQSPVRAISSINNVPANTTGDSWTTRGQIIYRV